MRKSEKTRRLMKSWKQEGPKPKKSKKKSTKKSKEKKSTMKKAVDAVKKIIVKKD